MTTTTRNEAAEHNRADWRVEQEPAYLLRVDKADHRLDSLSRAEFNDLLDEALAAAKAEGAREAVERYRSILADMAQREHTRSGHSRIRVQACEKQDCRDRLALLDEEAPQ